MLKGVHTLEVASASLEVPQNTSLFNTSCSTFTIANVWWPWTSSVEIREFLSGTFNFRGELLNLVQLSVFLTLSATQRILSLLGTVVCANVLCFSICLVCFCEVQIAAACVLTRCKEECRVGDVVTLSASWHSSCIDAGMSFRTESSLTWGSHATHYQDGFSEKLIRIVSRRRWAQVYYHKSISQGTKHWSSSGEVCFKAQHTNPRDAPKHAKYT